MKMKQLQEQLNAEKAKERAKERKERTRRLIETGAIFEKYFEISSKEEALKIAKALSDLVKSKKSDINKTSLTQEDIDTKYS